MDEDEARLLAVLIEQAAHPAANADARARQTQDGGWEVLLLWDQGPRQYGTLLTELSEPGDPPTTVDQFALDVNMFLIDEPHGPNGTLAADGRYWQG